MKTFLLIDANSLIHRCFHALPKFTAPDGKPSGALYGISNILLRIFREEKPDYAAALFDRPEPTFRDKIYPAYKAQRPKASDDLITQIIEARRLFSEFGVKVLEKPGAEADDLIAALAQKFGKEDDLKIIILTSDLDALQLVKNKKIVVRTFKKGISETFTYDEAAVQERYGLKPEQIVDYKALVGDPSDNIKGIAGIGPKTAAAILQKFGTLEKIYENLNKEKTLKDKLKNASQQAALSRKLVTLNKNMELDIKDLNDFRLQENPPELKKYFGQMGFDSFLQRLEKQENAEAKNGRLSAQGKIF